MQMTGKKLPINDNTWNETKALSNNKIYELDKLMQETRQLAIAFHQTTGNVLAVSSELARYDVARLLNLQTLHEARAGVDFVGTGRFANRLIQVKARVCFRDNEKGQRIGQLNLDGQWDMLMLALMNEQYETTEIYAIDRDVLLQEVFKNPDKKLNKRGAMSIAKFKAISECVWQKD
jgi:hypothetical protein